MRKNSAAEASGCQSLFRATTGLTLQEQSQLASQLESNGEQLLQKISQMKKASKKQKQTSKANNLKFEWLHEHSHLKKQEENCSREIESMMLKMYNSTSSERTKQENCTPRRSNLSTEPSSSLKPSETSVSFAKELEEILKMEETSRTNLHKQAQSEREQRYAMKQFITAVLQTANQQKCNGNNKSIRDQAMVQNVQHLLYDAVIGHEMIDVSLTEQVQVCEAEYKQAYDQVIKGLHADKNPSTTSISKEEEKIEKTIQQLFLNCVTEIQLEQNPPEFTLDEFLRLEFTQEFQTLHKELENDLTQLEQEFLQLTSSPEVTGSIELAKSKTGGWSVPDEERFIKVLKNWERKKIKKLELLLDQVNSILPQLSLKQIKAHYFFHMHLRFYQEKKKNCLEEFERKQKELLSQMKNQMEIFIQNEIVRRKKEENLRQIQEKQIVLHEKIENWKQTNEAKERIVEQQMEIEKLEQNQKMLEEQTKFRKKMELQKQKLNEYYQQKNIQELEQKQQQELEAVEKEKLFCQQQQYNAERVQYRQEEYYKKIKEDKVLQESKLQEQLLKQHQLDAIKQQTPYAATIAQIEIDPERTRQETIAFRANVEAAQEALPVYEAGLFPTHGYDCETLFKNARFKLGLALRDAGLHQSEYARQALANVKVNNAGAYRNHVPQPTQLW